MAENEEKAKDRKRRRRSKGSQTQTDEDDAPPPCCCSETLNMINEKLDVALAAVKEIQTLKEQVSELQTKNNHFEESLKFAYDEIQDLKSNVADLRETTSIQQQDIFALIDDLGAEKARGVKLESHSRRNNLRFFNIAEQANESYQDAEQALRKFLENDLGGGHDFATNISIERVHRTIAAKPPTTMKPRPIIAKFSYFKEKERIRMMAKNLKGTTFGIAEDYAPEVLEIMYDMLYKSSSAGDPGTLCSNMNITNNINAKTKKVLDNFNFCKYFVEIETNTFIVAATMNHFKMKSLNDEVVPDSIKKYSKKEKCLWLHGQVKLILEKFVMEKQAKEHQQVVDHVNTANQPKQRPVFPCKECGKPYFYKKARDNHEIQKHNLSSNPVEPTRSTIPTESEVSVKEDHIHNYACIRLSMGMLIFNINDVVKEGDGERIVRCWKFMLLIFKDRAKPVCHDGGVRRYRPRARRPHYRYRKEETVMRKRSLVVDPESRNCMGRAILRGLQRLGMEAAAMDLHGWYEKVGVPESER
ncbi:hypothetical protein QZH41_004490 [Actinostola sp. cb2023]|nr:hypothetical protein QZH41_004490 [Actinostola sp. cb2023]